MFRIYFDSNERTQSGNYILTIPGSLHDIQPIADKLRDGMRVLIYMAEELEMEAILEFDHDPQWGGWTARPIEGTIKYLDDTESKG